MSYTAEDIAAARSCAEQFRISAKQSLGWGHAKHARGQIEEAEWWDERANMWEARNAELAQEKEMTHG